MTRKEAFTRKNEVAHQFCSTSLYNRALASRWYEDHSVEQMNYLFKYGYIEYTEPMTNLGEYPYDKYIQYTKRGMQWREWYTMSFKEYLKYKIFGYTFWKYKVYERIHKFITGKYSWEKAI